MKKKIAVIAIFVIALVFSIVSWPFLAKLESNVELNENRNPEPLPKLNSEFFINFDKYFLDRVPLRKSTIKFMSTAEVLLSKAYSDILDAFKVEDYYIVINNVVFGKKDWLFYAYNHNIDYYCGTNLPSKQELDKYLERTIKVQNYFVSQGKKFAIFVAPNKEQIYSEYMPSGIKVRSEKKRMDIVQEYLINNNINIVYPKQALLDKKELGNLLYYKWDTHWNELGAYYGYCELCRALDITPASIDFTYETIYTGDMKQLLGANIGGEDYMYQCVYRPEITSEIVATGLDYLISSNNPNGKKIALFGDSYRIAIKEYFAKEYSSGILGYRDSLQSFMDNKMSINFDEMDVVVLQSVERNEYRIFGDTGLLQQIINKYNL